MKKILQILALAAAFMILSGCDRIIYVHSDSFVTDYWGTNLGLALGTNKKIHCYYEFPEKHEDYSLSSSGKEREIYDALCVKHGDTSYNREVRTFTGSDFPNPASFWKDFVSIEIVSDTDYDATHPAGTLLNDIIIFHSVSPKEYIRSGYTMIYDYSTGTVVKQTEIGSGEYYPIEKRADQLTPEDMTLIGGGSYGLRQLFDLSFTKGPDDTSKTHTISVKLTADDGTVYDLSIDYVFE